MKIISFLFLAAVVLAVTGCEKASQGSASATDGGGSAAVPRCATQDCTTGKIVDTGCTPDGRCVSCVNACPPE